MENTEQFWITSQRNWILCIHLLLNFQRIHPHTRLLTQPKPSSCKIPWYPLFQAIWYLCSSSTSFQKVFPQIHGIPVLWHSRTTGGCATLHDLFRFFLPRLQPHSMSPVQGEGDEQQRQLQEWLDRGSELSSFPWIPCVHLLASKNEIQRWKLQERFPSFQFLLKLYPGKQTDC